MEIYNRGMYANCLFNFALCVWEIKSRIYKEGGEMLKFYFHCKTPKENIHIKINADSEEEATNKLMESYKITEIITVNHKPPKVSYNNKIDVYDVFKRDQYPYIKNRNGKAIRIFI
jgi:hypothetical protein